MAGVSGGRPAGARMGWQAVATDSVDSVHTQRPMSGGVSGFTTSHLIGETGGPPNVQFLTVHELQQELAHFSEQALRQDLLAELRVQVRQDLREVLASVFVGSSDSTGGSPLDTRPSPLRIVAAPVSEEPDKGSPGWNGVKVKVAPDEEKTLDPKKQEGNRQTTNSGPRRVSFEEPPPPESPVKAAESKRQTMRQAKKAEMMRHNSLFGEQLEDANIFAASLENEGHHEKPASHWPHAPHMPHLARSKNMVSDKDLAENDDMTIGKISSHTGHSELEAVCRNAAGNVTTEVHLSRIGQLTEDEPEYKRKLRWIVGKLEASISFFIFLNGIFMGVQTDYQATALTEEVPFFFSVVEVMFCIIFTTELVLKLGVYHHRFFYMKGCLWNIFDFGLVVIQLIEVVGMLTAGLESDDEGITTTAPPGQKDASPVGNLSFLRLLRILRLMRVLRLVRLLHFVGELATIISSISNSLRPFLWILLLLMMIIYMIAIVFTQIVFSKRVEMKTFPPVGALAINAWTEEDASLVAWWGSLPRSALSLFEAILGGCDWEDVVRPLDRSIHPLLPFVFSIYIAFTLLCILNVITGTFVQSAMQGAENEKARDFINGTKAMFNDVGVDELAMVTWDQYKEMLEDPVFKSNLRRIDVSKMDARLLFRLLDIDRVGEVDFDKLIASMLRLQQGSKFMDIMKLMFVVEGHHRMFDKITDLAEDTKEEVSSIRSQVKSAVQLSSSVCPCGNQFVRGAGYCVTCGTRRAEADTGVPASPVIGFQSFGGGPRNAAETRTGAEDVSRRPPQPPSSTDFVSQMSLLGMDQGEPSPEDRMDEIEC